MCDISNVTNIETFRQHCQRNVTPENLQGLFNKFIPEDFWILGVNNPTSFDLEMQSALYGLCNSQEMGYLCSSILERKCREYRYNDLLNPTIRDFCGCYLPEQEYRGEARECTEPCQNMNSVNYFPEGSNVPSEPVICRQATCIIDNVGISILGGSSGNITFNQICPSCATGNCRCVINDVNIISSGLGGLKINQNCSSDSTCYITADDGTKERIDCQGALLATGLSKKELEKRKTRNIGIIYIASLAIILLILIIGI